MNSKTGTLYIVATPIGNLADLSGRAVEILSGVSLVLCEDTRHAGKLLGHYRIDARTRAFHEHNEQALTEEITGLLVRGEDIALVSDAGTPLISDPGYRLVRAARERGIAVSPIPGPSAVIAALSASALATDRFCFEGFLPAKQNQRIEKLKSLMGEERTLIFYESSHRISAALADLSAVFGEDRELTVAREITKKFETFYFGSPEQVLLQILSDKDNLKGEFVILLSGNADKHKMWSEACKLMVLLEKEMPLKKACRIAAQTFGVGKNALYEFALEQSRKTGES